MVVVLKATEINQERRQTFTQLSLPHNNYCEGGKEYMDVMQVTGRLNKSDITLY